VLDVRITHDFREVTTITEVRGRMSKPKLVLASQPGQYTQAELLGFLLGGEPGGDPENAPSTSERVAGAGASFVSNKVGGYVKKALPIDIDVLRYEAASSSSSAAVTVGTWITDTLFLAYRQHLEARPDENAGEGEVEYWIRRRLVLEAVVGDRGVNGLDLLWRRRW
jgi:autotransporter translocation and assembly factor TamB